MTKYYQNGNLYKQAEFEVICIKRRMTDDDYAKIRQFLSHVKSVLRTKECTFEVNEKNIAFDRAYPLRHEDKIRMVEKLEEQDCVDVGPNNNPRHIGAEVYTFIKNFEIFVYGEEEEVKLYIKMYLCDKGSYDEVIVISFHKEGMHD